MLLVLLDGFVGGKVVRVVVMPFASTRDGT